MLIEDWLESIENADDEQARWEKIVEAFESYGFERVIFLQGSAKSNISVRSNFDASWNEHYIEQGFLDKDPFLKHCCTTYHSIRTGIAHIKEHPYLSTEEIKVIEEASDAGFNSGFSCTIERFVDQQASAWNIGSKQTKSEVDKILQRHHNDLKILCFYSKQLLQKKIIEELTNREKFVLLLLSSGLRYKQIASELGISVSTVEFHLQNARKKLNAKTAEQAIALAVSNQLIDVSNTY